MKNDNKLLQRITAKNIINSDEHFCVNDYAHVTLNIELTTLCNAKCIYCIYSNLGVHKEGKLIEPEFFYKITKEAYDLGIREIGLYSIGEPLCNPKIAEYIRYLKNMGYTYIYLSTNGILCNLNNAKKMIDAGIDSIKFTISAATESNYFKHHGVDAFNIVEKNLIDIYKYRERNRKRFKIYLFYIITKYNLSEINDFKNKFEKYSDEIVFNNVMDGIISMKGMKEYLYVGNNDIFRREVPCKDLWNRIIVGVDKKTYTCCMLNTKYTEVFDLRKGSLHEAFNCLIMRNLRKQHLNGKIRNIVCCRCLEISSSEKEQFKKMDSKRDEAFPEIDITSQIVNRFEM